MSDVLSILPLSRPPATTIAVPGSKSITNRALVLAALATPGPTQNASIIKNALRCDDTEVMIACLSQLGITIQADWRTNSLTVPCVPRSEWRAPAELYCGNSGTTLRFLTAMLALGRGAYRLDGDPRMRERPVQDLLDALAELGVEAQWEVQRGYPPVVVNAHGLSGGKVRVRGDVSSQFLSGLLMASPLASAAVEISLVGKLVSWPYVAMTLDMMKQWGVTVDEGAPADSDNPIDWRIEPQPYRAETYVVEPDASAASYFWSAAAITGGEVTVPGLTLHGCLQGDVAFADVLRRMGCQVFEDDLNCIRLRGGPLRGIDVDLQDMSDTVMSLAAVALFAKGPTTIRGVAHIRHKESDRLAALAAELRKVGAEIIEFPDGLKIIPGDLRGALLDTYNDHRLAMSLALIGLIVPGISIQNPSCVRKTYPDFFADLDKLRQT